LELDKSPGMNAISTILQIGDGSNDVRVTLLGDHQIADGASVTIRSRGRLDLNGNDEAIGALQGEGTVSLDGRLGLGRSGRLTVSGGNFSGAIAGQGGLTKTGTTFSSLSLSGESTYSGQTIVSSGTLAVEGVLTGSPIRLDGGTLRGRGTVGMITANLGGTLQPGSGGADFNVALHSGDVVLNPSTTFRALLTSVDPGYENHKLQVSGSVNLGGCVLSVDLNGSFQPATNRSFLIIENDGTDAVLGTFAGLPEGAVFGGDGLPFRLTYVGGTGNDVVITRVAAPALTFSSITALGDGQMRMEALGISGVIYPIQAASNLNPVVFWTDAGKGTGNASGLLQFFDRAASNRPMRFYRVRSP
jgi:autotransporter-associated beta strand protein